MLKYSFALCVDPDTSKYYSINLTNYSIRMEECSEKRLEQQFKQKAENACQQLKEIISWEAFNYGITKQTQIYRRRRLPQYLLQDTKLKFPSYIVQEALPRAITIETVLDSKGQKRQIEKYEIDAEIYILQYLDIIKMKQPFISEHYRTIPKVFSCRLRLPNPINQIIKVIIKTAFQKQQIQLSTKKSDHQFLLKVYGSEYYLYGNTALMKYEYIRKCLRNKQPAKLQLTQRKFKQSSKFRAIVFQRAKKQVDQGIYKQIKWNELRNQQPFLWYPPTELTMSYQDDLKQKQDLVKKYSVQKNKLKQKQKQGSSITKTQQMQKLHLKLQKYSQQQKFQLPRLILKQHMIKLIQQKRNTSHKVIEIETKMILSGECEFSFDIKLIAIRRLNNILKESTKHEHVPKYFTQFRKNSFTVNKKLKLYVNIKFTYGDQILKNIELYPIPFSDNIALDKRITWDKLSCLPLETKLFIQIIARHLDNKETVHIGTASFNMFDEKGYLLSGQQKTNIWPYLKPDKRIAGCIGSYQKGFGLKQHHFSQIILQFPRFLKKVRWSLRNDEILHNLGYSSINIYKNQDKPKIQQISQLENLLSKDPLRMTNYSNQQKRILKVCHSNYSKNPQKYMNFLYSIDWSDPNDVHKAMNAREMLNKEKQQTVKSTDYIGVFASRFVDQAIRLHAVDKLIAVSDDEIIQYIPQLVQSLLMESIHHNSLSQFLLQRAVLSPFTIGQALFWELRSQLHKQFQFERYAVYLQCLAMCSIIRKSLVSQIQTNNVLTGVSERVISFKQQSVAAKNQYFQTYQIPQMRSQLPIPFLLAINPEKQNDDFLDSQCKVFSSKKKPLLLTLIQNPTRRKSNLNDSPKKKIEPVIIQRIIFKNGDDIHQDQLTLQILNIMDNIWLQQGLDLKMSLYRVLPVADMVGFIQVVGDSKSCSGIHKQNDPNGALKKQTYDNYLVKHNPLPAQYGVAVDYFIRSVAGYLVASYVLGLGDRHSDNVMITKSGKFFHIDFGHFLGNFKSKFGINRERSPFLFTSLFKYVIDKNNSWQYFIKLCGKAYNQIRKNANFIIQMFMLMTTAGIPQLSEQSHIQYLVDKLSLQLSCPQAQQKIRKQIDDALDIEYVKNYDNLIHDLKHG